MAAGVGGVVDETQRTAKASLFLAVVDATLCAERKLADCRWSGIGLVDQTEISCLGRWQREGEAGRGAVGHVAYAPPLTAVVAGFEVFGGVVGVFLPCAQQMRVGYGHRPDGAGAVQFHLYPSLLLPRPYCEGVGEVAVVEVAAVDAAFRRGDALYHACHPHGIVCHRHRDDIQVFIIWCLLYALALVAIILVFSAVGVGCGQRHAREGAAVDNGVAPLYAFHGVVGRYPWTSGVAPAGCRGQHDVHAERVCQPYGQPQTVVPLGCHVFHALRHYLWCVQSGVEEVHTADTHTVQPLEVLADAVGGDVTVQPVPPHLRASLMWRVQKARFHRTCLPLYEQ